jgi:tetratricopeptide (TPR) repeat protein
MPRLILVVLLACSNGVFGNTPSFENREGLYIMHLYGTRPEMARQHGEFIRERVEQTALPFFAGKIDRAIGHTYLTRGQGALTSIARWVVRRLSFDGAQGSIPQEDQAVLNAFAEGAQIERSMAYDGFTVPDVGQWLIDKIFSSRLISNDFFGPIGQLGCSTIVKNTQDGWVHARNLDYDGFGVWDRYPLVIHYHPDQGQEYVSFTSLGIHTAGITAANESGLVFGLHQLMVADTDLGGTPVLSAVEKAVREATTLREAVDIIRGQNHIGAWRIIVSSHRENQVTAIEVSGSHTEEVPVAPRNAAWTNHVLGEQLLEKQFSINYAYYSDTRYRLAALKEQLREVSTLQDSIDVISGHRRYGDAASERSSFHGIISKMNNIQSIVVVPEDKTAYVAMPSRSNGKPTSGSYVPVKLFGNTDREPTLRSRYGLLPNQVQAQAHYRQGARVATENGQYARAVRAFQRAHRLDSSHFLYALMAGWSYMRMSVESKFGPRERNWRRAHDAFRDAEARLLARREGLEDQASQTQPHSLGLATRLSRPIAQPNYEQYHLGLTRLGLAQSADLIGRREQAIAWYRQMPLGLSRFLDELRTEGLRRAVRPGSQNRLAIDFVHGALFQN